MTSCSKLLFGKLFWGKGGGIEKKKGIINMGHLLIFGNKKIPIGLFF